MSLAITFAISEALDPEIKKFNAAVRASMSAWTKQQTEMYRRLAIITASYSNEVVALVAPITDWDAYRLASVKSGLEEARNRYALQLSGEWQYQASRATAIAISGVDGAMIAAGAGKETLPVFVVNDRQLAIIENYVPSLIVDVGDDIHKQVQRILRNAMLGGSDTPEMIRKMQMRIGRLSSSKGTGTVFDKGVKRMRTIFRTESNRLHNLTRTQRIGEVSQVYPGLGSKWIHRHSIFPRPSHTALTGKIVFPAEGEKFNLSGFKIDGPHDLSLPAEEVINCHCIVVSHFDSTKAHTDELDRLAPENKTGVASSKKGLSNELTGV